MAKSSCVKCGGQRFELKEMSPDRANYKFMAVQCAACGGVVGIAPYFDLHTTIQDVKGTLGARIDNVEYAIKHVHDSVERVRRKTGA